MLKTKPINTNPNANKYTPCMPNIKASFCPSTKVVVLEPNFKLIKLYKSAVDKEIPKIFPKLRVSPFMLPAAPVLLGGTVPMIKVVFGDWKVLKPKLINTVPTM